MAYQASRVTGNSANPARRRLAESRRNALISRLPQSMALKQQKKLLARDAKFQADTIAHSKKALAQKKRAEEMAMGLEAGKLGFTMATSDYGDKTLGSLGKGIKDAPRQIGNIFRSKANQVAPKPTVAGAKPKTPGLISSIPIGSAIGGGLAGYGVSKMIKKKKYRPFAGALAGAAMGALGAKKGSGTSGAIAGGLLGLGGGLIS